MKILFNQNFNINNPNPKFVQKTNNLGFTTSPLKNIQYDTISFSGAKIKRLNIEIEKQKLLRTISKLLETDSLVLSQEEVSSKNTIRALKFIESKNKKLEDLCSKARVLNQISFLNPTMQYEAKRDIINEATRVQNSTYKEIQVKNEHDENKWDYTLLNKFKSAIINNNFDLEAVFKSHYSLLSDITDLDEMEQIFPKLNIPITPEEVISQNIVKGLTRNFYLKIADCYANDDYVSFSHLLTDALIGACTNFASTHPNLDLTELPLHLFENFSTIVMEKYRQGVLQGSFSFIPEFAKKQPPIATPLDIALLNINFDKFVINVYKQQHLDAKKLNEIVYTENGTKIELRKLNTSPYKFDKLSEKIKKIIKDASLIKKAQRDYDNFSIDELKARLDYFANNPDCENDVIFESIMNFYSSEFLPEDISQLKILLKELDSILDKTKTKTQVATDIQIKKIRPAGTQKLNEIERKKTFEKLKAEQQKTYELLAKQEEFDKVVNTLYTLQMTSVASLCADFRPHSLEDKANLERAEFLINYVNSSFIDNKLVNPNKFENDLFYWDVYHQYKSRTTYNSNKQFLELIRDGENFSKDSGKINPIKAGQYIFLTEMITTYPESLSVADSPEIFKKIMEKTDSDNQKALELLTKYDTYKDLPPVNKSQIIETLNIFDIKNSTEKSVIKQILEIEYLNQDTKIPLQDSKNNDTQIITITKEAKQQIYDKYKFPNSIDLFEAFETAATSFTADYGSSGIKRIGATNQSLTYKTEIKIKGYPDRLFASTNPYRFDIYSEKGLH